MIALNISLIIYKRDLLGGVIPGDEYAGHLVGPLDETVQVGWGQQLHRQHHGVLLPGAVVQDPVHIQLAGDYVDYANRTTTLC